MKQDDPFSDIRKVIAENNLLNTTRTLFVGFSGGADSTFLLLALANICPPVTAVHFHHGLRGEDADADAKWCEKFCEARQIPFTLRRLEVPANRCHGESIEEAARRCRHEFWQQNAPWSDGCTVALGHHQDDSLEDLLMRLARGSNASGLSGLRLARMIEDVRYIRPLLYNRRADIERNLHALNITDWREDPSNKDTHFRRNLIRHRWLPLIRETWGHDQGLYRSLENLRRDADFIEKTAADHVADVQDPAKLATMHPALFCRVIRLWLKEQTDREVIPSHHTLERLKNGLRQWDGHEEHRIPLGKKLDICITTEGLVLKTTDQHILEREWHWQQSPALPLPEAGGKLVAKTICWKDVPSRDLQDKYKEFFDPPPLPSRLLVRSWQAGDTMVPFGSRTKKKLQDIFTNNKIPKYRRNLVPLVTTDTHILWAVGIKRAEYGRISSPASNDAVVCLEFRKM